MHIAVCKAKCVIMFMVMFMFGAVAAGRHSGGQALSLKSVQLGHPARSFLRRDGVKTASADHLMKRHAAVCGGNDLAEHNRSARKAGHKIDEHMNSAIMTWRG